MFESIPHWDDLMFLPGTLTRFVIEGYREKCETRTRYTNAFLKIYFEIPEGREDEYARKVLIKHLQQGNSYGIWLKHRHAKFPQPELGSWLQDSAVVGTDWHPPQLAGWEKPAGH